MDQFIYPPQPTEEAILTIVTKEIALPNGRVLRLAMAQWHWAMIEFMELWNDHYNRPAGLLYEFHKRCPNLTDETFADGLMLLLRDDYNAWLAETPPDETPRFHDPRA